jgi:hypothetical protein
MRRASAVALCGWDSKAQLADIDLYEACVLQALLVLEFQRGVSWLGLRLRGPLRNAKETIEERAIELHEGLAAFRWSS